MSSSSVCAYSQSHSSLSCGTMTPFLMTLGLNLPLQSMAGLLHSELRNCFTFGHAIGAYLITGPRRRSSGRCHRRPSHEQSKGKPGHLRTLEHKKQQSGRMSQRWRSSPLKSPPPSLCSYPFCLVCAYCMLRVCVCARLLCSNTCSIVSRWLSCPTGTRMQRSPAAAACSRKTHRCSQTQADGGLHNATHAHDTTTQQHTHRGTDKRGESAGKESKTRQQTTSESMRPTPTNQVVHVPLHSERRSQHICKRERERETNKRIDEQWKDVSVSATRRRLASQNAALCRSSQR